MTIAPAFISGSIYLGLARIVVVYGEKISRIRPATYTIIFIGCDLFSLVLQSIGGGMAAQAIDKATEDKGVHIMSAGLAFQVASLVLFIILCGEFAFRVSRRKHEVEPMHAALRASFKFKAFLVCESALPATLWNIQLTVRTSSCYRHSLYPDSLRLSSRRTQSRFRRKTRPRTSHLYDPRRDDGRNRQHLPYRLPPWGLLPGQLEHGQLHVPHQETAICGHGKGRGRDNSSYLEHMISSARMIPWFVMMALYGIGNSP